MMAKIGIVGPIGSGKSFLAEHLAGALFDRLDAQKDIVIMPFAQILKEICSLQDIKILFNRDLILFDLLHYHGLHNSKVYADILQAFEDYPSVAGQKNRKLLQHVGTNIVRAHDEDFWVNATYKRLQSFFIFPEEHIVIIHDDVRFANEAAICDVLIEIVGKEKEANDANTHESELEEWRNGKQPTHQIEFQFTAARLQTLVDQLMEHESFMRG